MSSFSKLLLLGAVMSLTTSGKRHLDNDNLSETRLALTVEQNEPLVSGPAPTSLKMEDKTPKIYKPLVSASTCRNLCVFGGPEDKNKWCFNF